MRYLFFRCGYGHFFKNRSCPFDGWTYQGVGDPEKAFAADPTASILQLARLAKVDDFLRDRILIIESEALPLSLEGIQPTALVYDRIVTDDIAMKWPLQSNRDSKGNP